MEIISKLKNLSISIPVILASITGIFKGVEEFQYKILGKAHSVNEIYMRHLINDHIMVEEKADKNTMNTKEGYAEISKFKDDCIAVQRKTEYGDTISITVLPSPDKADKIRELYSNSSNVVYADGITFGFGVHLKDFDCKETKKNDMVVRTYSDKCCLRYKYDTKTGQTVDWVWIIYKH